MNRSVLFAADLILAISLLIAPCAVEAQTLEIAPITVDLPAGRMASSIRITNRGNRPTTVQVRPFGWSQPEGSDRLDQTQDIQVSPPFSTLEPGNTQIVRVILRDNSGKYERAYRLLVDQIPSSAEAGSIRVALRISLPVFAAPAGPARVVLHWKLVGTDPLKRTLIVRNDGTRRAKISNLKIGQLGTAPGFTFRYILPGNEAAIPVELNMSDLSAFTNSVHITATSDQGKVEGDASITPAA